MWYVHTVDYYSAIKGNVYWYMLHKGESWKCAVWRKPVTKNCTYHVIYMKGLPHSPIPRLSRNSTQLPAPSVALPPPRYCREEIYVLCQLWRNSHSLLLPDSKGSLLLLLMLPLCNHEPGIKIVKLNSFSLHKDEKAKLVPIVNA